MSVREIIYWPNKVLRTDTSPYEHTNELIQKNIPLHKQSNEDVERVCIDLIDTMDFLGGIGLAAPQINEFYSIFVISNQITGLDKIPKFKSGYVFRKANIIEYGDEIIKEFEGCLSFPDIYLKVPRPNYIKVKALDILGNEFELEASGLLSRAIQHELDHLNGKLMIDFVGKLKKEMVKKKLAKWKKYNAQRDKRRD